MTTGRCIQILRSHILILTSIGTFAACSSVPETQRSDMRDRYEDSNRAVFDFNMGFDTYVVEPVASGYRKAVPEGGQTAIAHHLAWAGLPSTAINSSLQGKYENAGLAVLNFAINGLTLGFVDLMGDDAAPIYKEDFGQTLAAADIDEGSYLMVPFLGPHTTRSLTGRVVDMVMNPYSIVEAGAPLQTWQTARAPAAAVSFRAANFEAFNDVKYNALDPYARTRSVYYQQRNGLLGDKLRGGGTSSADDEFEDFFGEDG
ncbi:MlaA family lipoprotein [Candidatus Puniceispirillum marinum]|uniref:VacJ-like lipoprotein, putative n=1 Tax=Puniceispirillum marinum (strain IMCC1322) TaxID=488538 RepID=D5BPR1_PUNMI|nr:VacJ family lipoprotein [Candidatus Puniceispirillum marinum]ADE40563.1 VacJ-like lipoprotein, putative [Candidatus Puniceispirillum marinum IMCC1322]